MWKHNIIMFSTNKIIFKSKINSSYIECRGGEFRGGGWLNAYNFVILFVCFAIHPVIADTSTCIWKVLFRPRNGLRRRPDTNRRHLQKLNFSVKIRETWSWSGLVLVYYSKK